MASPAIETVRAIIVTLNTKATNPWAVTVLRMMREVIDTSDTCVEVPMTKAK